MAANRAHGALLQAVHLPQSLYVFPWILPDQAPEHGAEGARAAVSQFGGNALHACAGQQAR